MLAGFYVVALAQLAAAGALAIWLASVLPGTLALKLTFPLFTATVGAVTVAMWRAIRTKPQPPHGLPVTPQEAPTLWGTVRELAQVVGTRMPDEIRLVPEINAAVMEESRLMGLVGGRRYLYIGLPLLQALSVSQIRSVLAHELGHYSGRHTRLGGVAYRGRLAIAGTVERIGPYNQASVRVAGRTAAASAPRTATRCRSTRSPSSPSPPAVWTRRTAGWRTWASTSPGRVWWSARRARWVPA